MQAPLIRPNVIRSIVFDVFRIMLKLEVKPQLAGETSECKGTKVTGVITMSGTPSSNTPSYGVILEMSEKLAFKIAAVMLQQEINEWSGPVEDACGEIANMIAGNAKKHLIATHILSMPTVVYGADYQWCMPHLKIDQVENFFCGNEPFRLYIATEIPHHHF